MIYHQLDFHLIISILKKKNKEKLISSMAKNFDWEDEIPKEPKDQERYWRNKYNLIIKRLNIMEKEGLMIILDNNTKKEYSLIEENVVLKKTMCPDGEYKNCLWIKESNNDWQMYVV